MASAITSTAVSPTTTKGDLSVNNGSGVIRKGVGANNTILKADSAEATGVKWAAVDVADLSNGTDGELITWDAAGAPATVAVGTAAQVLTSNGAGAAPTFQTPAAGGNSLFFQAAVTGTVSIPNATFTKVTFANEIFDADAVWNGTNRFTAPSAGKYNIQCSIQPNSAAANVSYELYLKKNNTTFVKVSINVFASTTTETFTVGGVLDLASSDYIELFIYHNIGSASTISATANNSFFEGYKLD